MKRILLSSMLVITVVGLTAGATRAVFSDTSTIAGNTISTAKVDLDAHNFTGNKPIGVTVEKLVPGQWTAEGRAELYNKSDVSVKVYMYLDGVTGVACGKTNLKIDTGSAGGNEHARQIVNKNVLLMDTPGERIEITGDPPFATLQANWSQVVWQKAQLDSSADNSYQGTGCTWNEVFVAENL